MTRHWISVRCINPKILIVGIASGGLMVGGIVAAFILTTVDSNYNIDEVATTRQEKIVETEIIDFETIEKEDNNKNSGTSETQQEGQEGEKSIEYLVTYDSDGNEISREKISEEITVEPKDKIVVIGTKKEVSAVAPKPTTPKPTASNTAPGKMPSSASQPEDPCRTKLAGWGRPLSCPPQTRAEFTALGGWETIVKVHYETHQNMEPMTHCDYTGTVCEEDWSGTTSGLCYGSVSIDMKTLTVKSVKWDNQPTSTCDPVRNEYPPLPSTDYLTQYLRSLAK